MSMLSINEQPYTTLEQRAERLTNLRRVLVEVGERAKAQVAQGKRSPFEMTYWGHTCEEDDELAPACGTRACAAGWAGKDTWFIKEGLELKRPPDGDDSYPRQSLVLYFHGRYHYDTFHELAKFFGITSKESDRLFDPCAYAEWEVGTEHVIERLDKMIEAYGVS